MQFNYSASDKQGKRYKGKIDAVDARHARNRLREKGLQIEALRCAKKEPLTRRLSYRSKLNNKDLVAFTRQLATLFSAAIPVEECLHALESQSEKMAMQHMTGSLVQKIREGETLSSAMASWPHFFSPVYRATVRAGESAGKLDKILIQLADYTESTQAMKGKLLQAMIYPTMLTTVAIAVITILLTAVVPQVTEQFIHMNQALPLSTQLLMGISDYMIIAGPWVLTTLLFFIAGLKSYIRDPVHKCRWDRLLVSLPLAGPTLRDLEMARYTRTLSILNYSAVPLTRAMQISASVLSNLHIRGAMIRAGEQVNEGGSFSQSLMDTGQLSPMMLHLIKCGERAGELSRMLSHVADIQDKRFNTQVSVTMSLFEPTIIVIMAAIVLFIITAILQPILQLNSLIV